MTRKAGELRLVPWHIGDRGDLTLNAVRAARELKVWLVEDAAQARRQFETELGVDCRDKEFRALPPRPDAEFLHAVRADLRCGDVGLACSGGVPCFVDPGGWLVEALRDEGFRVRASAGASVLSTLLSLSGFDWPRGHSRGTFVVWLERGPGGKHERAFLDTFRRKTEPVFVLLEAARFRECLGAMARPLGRRPVTVFFDLTKTPREKYPYADRVETRTCREWLAEAERIRWDEVSDVALMVHPERRTR